jgi:hypothetical protein
MQLRLDCQKTARRCECGVEYPVVRGSVFDGAMPVGLYLVALHGHSEHGRGAHLAIALLQPTGDPVAVAMRVHATPAEIQFSFVDWTDSPWRTERYLGRQWSAEEARASSLKADFVHVAEHVVRDLASVGEYVG